MKRSTVNRVIETAKEVFATVGLPLPPFAHWTVDDWAGKGSECDEIRRCLLGWDVTDFGQGNFPVIGRVLFTLRNGAHFCLGAVLARMEMEIAFLALVRRVPNLQLATDDLSWKPTMGIRALTKLVVTVG